MSSANSYVSGLLKMWKQARLPWRQRIFVGSDLHGNEYYESNRPINGRKKRIVEMRENKPLGEFNSDSLPELIIQRAKALDKDWERRKELSRGEIPDKSKQMEFEGGDGDVLNAIAYSGGSKIIRHCLLYA
ncbi:20759_t:CDS:2 [Dentiscutata erythropus]|uniref:20759_t:CDS:1 n=1 Tax=Dentiscutata erythropus TaxID=1348616 RepID=A0A9N9ACQ2_9GLOM|nr:20759_t:CDS:2 [Dentiscutata erythropus]